MSIKSSSALDVPLKHKEQRACTPPSHSICTTNNNEKETMSIESSKPPEDFLLTVEDQGTWSPPPSDNEFEETIHSDSDYEEEDEDDIPSTPTAASSSMMNGQDDARASSVNSSQELQWKKYLAPRKLIPFGGVPGNTNRRFKKNPTPLDCFLQFFTMETFAFIAEMTNMNALRKFSKKVDTWRPVTVNDIVVFLALFMTMGIVHLGDIKDYWQKRHWVIDLPSFNQIMPRDRFMDILHALHFCNENEAPEADDPNRDRLFKVRPILARLLEKFQSVHKPGQNLSIDESLIPFKGRISFRQFIPSKRARYGIKTFVLADSVTGYVSRLKFYTGKDSQQATSAGLSSKVVEELIQPYQHLGYHLYLDNYYSSPELFNWLYERHVYACGTIRPSRAGYPKELVIQKMTSDMRGQSRWLASGPLLAQSWVDNRVVYFLSTFHRGEYQSEETPQTVKRRGKKRSAVPSEFPCPPLLKDYNSYMGGVDKSDQMRKYFTLNRKSMKWYRKVFFYMVELAIHNARVVSESAKGSRVFGKEFRLELIESMVETFKISPPSRTSQRSSLIKRPQRLQSNHLPVMAQKRSRCAVCTAKYAKGIIGSDNNVSKVRVRCEDCNVFLCFNSGGNCFKTWHSKLEYWR